MAKSLKHIIASVKETLSGFVVTDDMDQKLDDDLIKDKVKDIRALLLREDVKTKGYVSEGFYQRICCLELDCDTLSCASLPVSSNITEWYVSLPELVQDVPDYIRYLGTADFKNPFTELTIDGYLYSEYRPFTSKLPYYLVLRDTTKGLIALIKNRPTLATKYLCIIAVVDNPESVCEYDEDDIYPIPKDLVHKLEYLVIRHFAIGLGVAPDLISDANAITQQQKPPKEQQDE